MSAAAADSGGSGSGGLNGGTAAMDGWRLSLAGADLALIATHCSVTWDQVADTVSGECVRRSVRGRAGARRTRRTEDNHQFLVALNMSAVSS